MGLYRKKIFKSAKYYKKNLLYKTAQAVSFRGLVFLLLLLNDSFNRGNARLHYKVKGKGGELKNANSYHSRCKKCKPGVDQGSV